MLVKAANGNASIQQDWKQVEGKGQKQKGSLSPSEGKRTAGENRFDNILKRSVKEKRRTVMCVNEVFTPACIDERVRRRETDDEESWGGKLSCFPD